MAVERVRTLILGAAGGDFHNFNVVYRDDPHTEVVAFTATQIPGIAGRLYPATLAGRLYPHGIPVVEEHRLEALRREQQAGRVVFAYSDVPHEHVMHLASRALAAGADFVLLGPRATMVRAQIPVIAVSAVRTGAGKSPIARWLSRHLRQLGKRVAVLRHPMPYGDLERARVQRFASRADLDAAACTAEEREEYEPHLRFGNVVFAGVDYAQILGQAQREADLVVWDGGNNDFPFIVPDLHLAVVDALRPLQIATHHPGEAVVRMAHAVVINKVNAAPASVVDAVAKRVADINPGAAMLRAASVVRLEDEAAVRGRRVLVVEDGPTITHGGMPHGAGYAAALAAGAREIVDPRTRAPPLLQAVYAQYPHIGRVLPAMGYSPTQLECLAAAVAAAQCDVVVAGTPIDLAALVALDKPVVRATYEFAEAGEPRLQDIVDAFLCGALPGRQDTRTDD